MTIRIPEIVSNICYDNQEYTPQEVADYLSDTGDDEFIGANIFTLRATSHQRLREVVEKYGLTMESKLQKDSSEAGKLIAEILQGHSSSKIRLIQRSASERHIWL